MNELCIRLFAFMDRVCQQGHLKTTKLNYLHQPPTLVSAL